MYKYNVNNQVYNKQVYIQTVQKQQVSCNQLSNPTGLNPHTHTPTQGKQKKNGIQLNFIYKHKKYNKVFFLSIL